MMGLNTDGPTFDVDLKNTEELEPEKEEKDSEPEWNCRINCPSKNDIRALLKKIDFKWWRKFLFWRYLISLIMEGFFEWSIACIMNL